MADVDHSSNRNLAMQLGELRGQVNALDGKLDGVAADVKSLVARESARRGREELEAKIEDRDLRREQMRISLFGGGAGAGLLWVLQQLGRKFGWTS